MVALGGSVSPQSASGLAAERPGLAIDPTTTWQPTIVWPYMLEVSHYLFFTKAWELGLAWHVMIPPYDWTTILSSERATR